MNEEALYLAQEDLYQRTLADAFLAQVNIIRDDVEDIETEVAKSIGLVAGRNGKLGACIIVQQPIADPGDAEVIGAILETEFVFLVMEDPKMNRGANGTGLRALTICRRLVALHHLYHPRGLMSVFEAKRPCIVPVGNPLAPVAYEVRFGASEEIYTETVRVSTPVITSAGTAVPQSVTLSCSTSGAAIYYTLDGSHPWSGNGEAVAYAGAFNVTEAAQLRVAAFKTGMIASDVNAKEFTA